jgi:uncharacterized protein (TIGR00251 family)
MKKEKVSSGPATHLKDSKEGTILAVKIVPNASNNAIARWENGELKVRLNAVPEKGKANEELISFLAKSWKLPKNSLSILSGESSRHKKLLIRKISKEKLAPLLPSLVLDLLRN